MNIIEAIEDKKVFGRLLKTPDTWGNWKVCLKAIFGLEMTPAELKIYRKFTGWKIRSKFPWGNFETPSGRLSS
jgi:hypothetical protein